MILPTLSNFPLLLVAVIAVVSFLLGMIFKWGLLKKYQKRIFQLENEMLSNHSRILSLEKKNADLLPSDKQHNEGREKPISPVVLEGLKLKMKN